MSFRGSALTRRQFVTHSALGVDAARAAHLGNLAFKQQRRVKWEARLARVES